MATFHLTTRPGKTKYDLKKLQSNFRLIIKQPVMSICTDGQTVMIAEATDYEHSPGPRNSSPVLFSRLVNTEVALNNLTAGMIFGRWIWTT